MIKTEDLKNLKKIEKQIGIKLKELPIEHIGETERGYSCDDEGNITGFNLPGTYETQLSDISFLKGFTHLTQLSLFGNQISDLSPLQPLTSLTILGLGGNQISDLLPLHKLDKLTELNLDDNQISDLSPLHKLDKLTELYLDDNQISDLSPLKPLTNLIKLYLRGNKIFDLPTLLPLKELKTLDLRYNKISKLPKLPIEWTCRDMEIKWEYDYKDGLFLEGNPLQFPPIEIVQQGHSAVLNYFDEIQQEPVHLLHAKLLLVGRGDVGKTTLVKKLKDNDFIVAPGQETTTHGINIVPWELDCTFANGDTHPVKINSWDFGGQDIMYTTHQFFLTKRSLYLFAWEARQEGQETAGFDYWLNIINLLSTGSPVIVVMNKSDSRIQPIDEASFQEKFPNIQAFCQVSCLTGDGIPELTAQIRTCLAHMQHLLDKLPKAWMEIRTALKNLGQSFISLDDYFEICEKHGLNQERAEYLSDYLHDLGAILHFRGDPLLENTVILDPEWATSAVYKIMDQQAIMAGKGRFHYQDLKTYWDKKKFPAETYLPLIRLMEKFELCFPVMDTDIHIVPELLPPQRTDVDIEKYREPGSLHFEYHYDFMPRGILSRFLSRLYYLIHREHFWKTGVELVLEKAFALVLSEPLNRKLTVSATGDGKSELLTICRNQLDQIHLSLNMEQDVHYKEMVPCNCSECLNSENPHLFRHNVLKKFTKKGRDFHLCDVSAAKVSIKGLLKGFKPPPKTDLLQDLIKTASMLQGIAGTIKPDEDSRNGFIALLLTIYGYRALDQTRRGKSPGGKKPGELDILVESKDGTPDAVIEAFNLKFFSSDVIDSHFKKIFDYDAWGLENNYLMIYVESADFLGLWQKYLRYLPDVALQYKIINGPTEEETPYADIKLARTLHDRQGRETGIYHLFVKMNI
jgi:internalin A